MLYGKDWDPDEKIELLWESLRLQLNDDIAWDSVKNYYPEFWFG